MAVGASFYTLRVATQRVPPPTEHSESKEVSRETPESKALAMIEFLSLPKCLVWCAPGLVLEWNHVSWFPVHSLCPVSCILPPGLLTAALFLLKLKVTGNETVIEPGE